MENTQYRICSKCIMDTTDPNIEFDDSGVCSNCKGYEKNVSERVFKGKEGKEKLNKIVEKIKEQGSGKDYDCIVGLSGGVDSTYVAYLAKKKLGLRPLAVHMDNGWNSKTANKNISKIVKKLEIDLHTHVVNWEEFKDLQLSYLRASVVDIEAITDYAIKAALYKIANEKNIKYILSGVNLVTEGILPKAWRYNKGDTKNLLSIHKEFGNVKLNTFPILTIFQRGRYQFVKKIQEVEVLNYLPYDKEKTKSLIAKEVEWEDYGSKHGESVFTKFYQAYILPKKFNIDKRRAHLSTLVCSGQMNREDAISEMKKPINSEENLQMDKEYVIKKLGLNEEEFDEIMKAPVKSHYDYKNNDKLYRNLRSVYLRHLKN